jgi:hypothetical protein
LDDVAISSDRSIFCNFIADGNPCAAGFVDGDFEIGGRLLVPFLIDLNGYELAPPVLLRAHAIQIVESPVEVPISSAFLYLIDLCRKFIYGARIWMSTAAVPGCGAENDRDAIAGALKEGK